MFSRLIRLIKRLRLIKHNIAVLEVITRPDSLEGSNKVTDNKSNGRRKANLRARVRLRELLDYINIEKSWLDSSLSRYYRFREYFKTQNRLIILLETLNIDIY